MAADTYFDRHWHGDLPLWVSYWINHVLLSTLTWQLTKYGIAAVKRGTGEQPTLCLAFAAIIIVCWFVLQVWQIGGVWRCAARVRQQGSPVRAALVRTVLCFAVVGMFLLPAAILLPIGLAVANGQPVPILGSVLRDGGRMIDFTGPVTETSAEEFRRVLDGSQASLVRLQSNGGFVVQARAIAAMIRRRGMDTEVSGTCASACTIMFFAGRRRALVGHGRIGFHSYWSMQETPQALLRAEDSDRHGYLLGGVSAGFVERMFNVPPAQMWYPTRQEAEAAGFATPTFTSPTTGR